jgi:hypothetical protein
MTCGIHPLECRCGKLRGTVAEPSCATHLLCYCRDCQAYAHTLGDASSTLDANGGTEIVQTRPAHVAIVQGRDELTCLRLTENGLLRWYARCCNTPVGNTSRNRQLAFVGLVHTCLGTRESIEKTFGPIRNRVNTAAAKGSVDATPPLTLFALLLRISAALIRARLDGSYRNTPFFDANEPIAAPRVLTKAERERAMNAV